jgi:hypothetical protein
MPVIMINMPVSGLSRYMAAMLWGRVGGGAGTSPRRAGDRRRNSAADLRDIPGLRSIQLFGTKDLHGGRCGEDLAKIMHPLVRVFRVSGAAGTKLIELIKVCQLNLELQSRPTSVAAR